MVSQGVLGSDLSNYTASPLAETAKVIFGPIGFVIYTVLELVFGWRILRWLFFKDELLDGSKWYVRAPKAFVLLVVSLAGFFLFARGGLQQIPINIDSAYFTNNHVANDISVNSVYYFGNSFLLYNRSEIDEFLPNAIRFGMRYESVNEIGSPPAAYITVKNSSISQ